MSVASTRLGYGAALGVGLHTLYTCPSGKRTIVKSVALYNNGGAANRVVVEATVGSTTVVLGSVLLGAAGSATETTQFPCWLVLHQGDVLKVAPQNFAADVYASGTELTL